MHFPNPLRFLLFLILTVTPILVFGQYYNLGQDPSSLKWRQIVTPHFKIIYPENFEKKALKMLPTLDFVYTHETKTLSYLPARIPIVIHNYNTESNAVTAWAPKRIEMYTNPPQDSYAQDWMTQLMIHEYRHVIQIDRTNQGFTRFLSWLTGEQATTAINGLFVPQWFMEGDAVCTETAFSQSGRGRVPNFEMLLRAQVSQKGAYTYDKAAFGSYITYVPDKYVLGYSLVANVRRKYGYQSWITALDEVARKPFIITPFNHGLKKATGFGKENLYRITMLDMDSMWKSQDALTPKTRYKQLTYSKIGHYDNFKYPQYLTDSSFVAEYSSMDDITRFVEITPKGEKWNMTTPGFLSAEPFSVARTAINLSETADSNQNRNQSGYILAWTETINDPRWQQRKYSVIQVFNSNTQETKTLTPKGRYFAPVFSPDRRSIVAVRTSPENRNAIVIIDLQNGQEKDTIIDSDSDFFMTPSWSADGKEIIFIRLDEKGKSIQVCDLYKKTIRTLVPPTFTEISNPVFAGSYVLFNGSYTGIENVYAISLDNNIIYQVTSAEFGASNAMLSPNGKKLAYSNYSSSGYDLAEIDFEPASWKKLEVIHDFSPSLYKNLLNEEGSIADIGATNAETYKSQPYKKLAHIFNFHSWAPAYINYMSGENGTGISFMSQNELSTATTVVGYKYDIVENTGKVTADFNWMAWYPVIDVGASYGARAAYTGSDLSVRYNFNETTISGGFTLPLLFTGGKYYKGLNLQVHTSFINITDNTSPESNKLTGTINSLDYNLYAYRYIKQSTKDLYPLWGQALTFGFSHSPFGDNNLGSILWSGVRLYFPGIMKHHSIKFDFNWQLRNPGDYEYSTQINLPRGYTMVNENELTCFAFNYKFPLAYPDFSAGPFMYLKRLKANLFYDGGIGTTDGNNKKFQSTGIEITSDLHLLRFVFPFDLGVRLGYMPIEKQYFTNFLFSVNLSN